MNLAAQSASRFSDGLFSVPVDAGAMLISVSGAPPADRVTGRSSLANSNVGRDSRANRHAAAASSFVCGLRNIAQ
jgi:hypothetical protein